MKAKHIAILMAAAAALCAVGCKTQDQIDEKKMTLSNGDNNGYFDARSTVTVTGRGMVRMEPDLAEIGFTVVSQRKDASEAQQENVELMDGVISVIKSKGIADEDMETGGLSINEMYDYDKSPARITGYEVRYTVEVKVRNMDILGALISEAVAAGATNISGPEYTIEDDSAAYLEALALAVASADAKAETIAVGLGDGTRLAPLPVSITENGGVNYAMVTRNEYPEEKCAAPMADSGLKETQAAIPKIEMTATVNSIYQIIR